MKFISKKTFIQVFAQIFINLTAFWIGAIVGVLLILISNIFSLFNGKKRITLKTEIPFAPFMILGVFIVFIFGLDIYSITSLFSF